jgi:hypothetical protein
VNMKKLQQSLLKPEESLPIISKVLLSYRREKLILMQELALRELLWSRNISKLTLKELASLSTEKLMLNYSRYLLQLQAKLPNWLIKELSEESLNYVTNYFIKSLSPSI